MGKLKSVSDAFGFTGGPDIDIPDLPPGPDDQEVVASRRKERKQLKRRRGFRSTILAGGTLGDFQPTTRPTLLG